MRPTTPTRARRLADASVDPTTRATATPVFETGPTQRAHAEEHTVLYDELQRRAMIEWGHTRFVEKVPYRLK